MILATGTSSVSARLLTSVRAVASTYSGDCRPPFRGRARARGRRTGTRRRSISSLSQAASLSGVTSSPSGQL
jgi:hypothetical protein